MSSEKITPEKIKENARKVFQDYPKQDEVWVNHHGHVFTMKNYALNSVGEDARKDIKHFKREELIKNSSAGSSDTSGGKKDDGNETIGSLIRKSIELGTITKKANWHLFDGKKIANGFKATVKKLTEDEALCNLIIAKNAEKES